MRLAQSICARGQRLAPRSSDAPASVLGASHDHRTLELSIMSMRLLLAAPIILAVVGSTLAHGQTSPTPSQPVYVDTIRVIPTVPNDSPDSIPWQGKVIFSVSDIIVGPNCGTNRTFSIDLARSWHRDVYALLLIALADHKKIQVEFLNDDCSTWGQLVRSVTLSRS